MRVIKGVSLFAAALLWYIIAARNRPLIFEDYLKSRAKLIREDHGITLVKEN